MAYKYFSHNGDILPTEQAAVPLDNVEYSYGFGVYETIRVTNEIVYFAAEHCARLMESARIIGLEHTFSAGSVEQNISELARKMQIETCNVKVLLVGGRTKDTANLYIMCLNPLFPDRKLYKTGAHCVTRHYERAYPHAKTLNMLPSYLAYREAKKAGAYDALLINREGCVIEGTRTNFFAVKGRTIFSPPEKDILLGVTRGKVLETARKNNFEILEQDIKLSDISKYDGAFLTSTSSKIMPIRSIDNHSWAVLPDATLDLMAASAKFPA